MTILKGFRPQQGLSIMNNSVVTGGLSNDLEFPSPTGVKYYELLNMIVMTLYQHL